MTEQTQSKIHNPKSTIAVVLILAGVLAMLTACHGGPVPVYSGPQGMGRLRYDKERGIFREGSQNVGGEVAMYEAARTALANKDWAKCVSLVDAQLKAYPDGGRAVDGILTRLEARLEAGRPQSGGLPHVVSLEGWFFLYLSPSYDSRIKSFMARGGENARIARELRDRSFEGFIEWISADARSFRNGGYLEPLSNDVRLLVNYYLPAMEFEDYRVRTAEIARNVVWLAYAAKAYDYVVSISADIHVMNPSPSVKADVLFVEGLAQMHNGAYSLAANTFNRLFRGANLRDTDTPWRPYALYWLIVSTTRKSKGPQYDIVPYEQGIELLGDYNLYLVENPGVSPVLRERFNQLIREVYEVMVQRDLHAAQTYALLGLADTRDYYIAHAEEWRKARDKRLPAASKP
ncbi:MAG: hypothetical protein IT462_12385 [Planctomycetes bacterium]|nr:hypothetical protein [Planctomycetota bacterium]